VSGFDNVFQSLFMVLLGVSKEGWSDIMGYTFESVSYVTVIYWVALVTVAAFFVAQLVGQADGLIAILLGRLMDKHRVFMCMVVRCLIMSYGVCADRCCHVSSLRTVSASGRAEEAR